MFIIKFRKVPELLPIVKFVQFVYTEQLWYKRFHLRIKSITLTTTL